MVKTPEYEDTYFRDTIATRSARSAFTASAFSLLSTPDCVERLRILIIGPFWTRYGPSGGPGGSTCRSGTADERGA